MPVVSKRIFDATHAHNSTPKLDSKTIQITLHPFPFRHSCIYNSRTNVTYIQISIRPVPNQYSIQNFSTFSKRKFIKKKP